MRVFRPNLLTRRVYDITKEMLDALGVSALVLDVDNTLTTTDNPTPHPPVAAWLEEMEKAGIKMIILSNNSAQRVEPFAGMLGLAFLSRGLKPLPFGVRRAVKKLQMDRRQVAVVGDQLFTDMAAGNLWGCKTILVEPMEREPGLFFAVKRAMETPLLRRYRREAT